MRNYVLLIVMCLLGVSCLSEAITPPPPTPTGPTALLPTVTVTPAGLTSPAPTEVPALRLTSTPTPRPATLWELAQKRGIDIGAQGTLECLDSGACSRILANEFSRMVVDFLWAIDRPERGSYDWRRIDRLMEFARANQMRVQGLHLVWGARELLPDWLKNGTFTRDELLAILHEHVTTVASHYKGHVDIWSVVNESLNKDDFWGERIGPEYIDMAFRWAREADPSAILIYNDYDNEIANSRSDAIYQMIAQLKAKGTPIDGLGMQMHLLNPDLPQTAPGREDVIANMRRFGHLGAKVYVTEFDVTLDRMPGTQKEKWDTQAAIYRDMLGACLESGVCPSFSTYGVSDALSWYVNLGLRDPEPLLFDVRYQPKPAYYALREALGETR